MEDEKNPVSLRDAAEAYRTLRQKLDELTKLEDDAQWHIAEIRKHSNKLILELEGAREALLQAAADEKECASTHRYPQASICGQPVRFEPIDSPPWSTVYKAIAEVKPGYGLFVQTATDSDHVIRTRYQVRRNDEAPSACVNWFLEAEDAIYDFNQRQSSGLMNATSIFENGGAA